jgi:hypothetical protein
MQAGWKVEERMIRTIRAAMILGVAVATSSALGFAQSTATSAASGQTSVVAVPADQEPTTEQLTKLFEVMRLKEQMQSMRQMVPAMVQQQVKAATAETEAGLPPGSKLTPEQRAAMEKVMNKYVAKAIDIYPADEMLTDMSGIYQRHLSKDDVDGMIAFYSAPAGQHLLDAQPLIAKEYMPIVMSKVTERSQAMTKEMIKEMTEIWQSLKQSAPKPAANAGTTSPPAQ